MSGHGNGEVLGESQHSPVEGHPMQMNGDHLPHPHQYDPHEGIEGSPEEGQQEEYYEGHMEGDEQQYEEEEEGCATKKLVGSRIARKQAEDDVKLLANRIALLKMEE
jgi:hypothetical protein